VDNAWDVSVKVFASEQETIGSLRSQELLKVGAIADLVHKDLYAIASNVVRLSKLDKFPKCP